MVFLVWIGKIGLKLWKLQVISFIKNNPFILDVLKRMEEMLNGFQSDLSSISSEIQTLQSQSVAMNVKLKNRQAVRGELSQFVDEMVVPESMIK